jgi:hypothetical protein
MTERSEVLLALDLATTTGFVAGAIGGTPVHGSKRLASPGASGPEVFGGYIAWLVDMIKVHAPRVVVYEAPLAPSIVKGKTNVNTVRRLMGLAALTEGVAYRMGIYTVLEATVADVRQHFIGRRNLPGDEGKRAVAMRCRQLGYEPTDDNAADALALWDYACAMRNPKLAALSTPMFKGAAHD